MTNCLYFCWDYHLLQHANQLTSFSDQVFVSELQHLFSKSNIEGTIHLAADFDVKNPSFYPVQSRCPAVDNFQHLVRKELVSLHQSQVTSKKHNFSNINSQ